MKVKVKICQSIIPSDGSEPLPIGEYEVSDIHFLGGGENTSLITFVVVEGDLKGSRRRIGLSDRSHSGWGEDV